MMKHQTFPCSSIPKKRFQGVKRFALHERNLITLESKASKLTTKTMMISFFSANEIQFLSSW